GPSYEAVERSLKVLATALVDMGGTLEKVYVKYPDRTVISPNLEPEERKLRVNYARKMLGLKISADEAINCLRRCRLDAEKLNEDTLRVLIPPYRIDILHEVDLVEEVAVGYGYYRLKPTTPKVVTVGRKHPIYVLADRARQIMIGLGYLEVMNFTLTNERVHYEFMRLKPKNPVKIANPVSLEYTIMRQMLLPGLMKNLAENTHESYPQRIFEVSDVVRVNRRLETMCERRMHLAAATAHSEANFTEVKSICEALITNLDIVGWQIRAAKHPSFLQGRTAALYVGNKRVGILGEVHPEVLNNFQIENPVAAFEIDLEILKSKA
ncbi:MAG: phenylalanine--tRNA ligase subunit beta, partial [Candidatus Bathyarchaeia archaeon]